MNHITNFISWFYTRKSISLAEARSLSEFCCWRVHSLVDCRDMHISRVQSIFTWRTDGDRSSEARDAQGGPRECSPQREVFWKIRYIFYSSQTPVATGWIVGSLVVGLDTLGRPEVSASSCVWCTKLKDERERERERERDKRAMRDGWVEEEGCWGEVLRRMMRGRERERGGGEGGIRH